MTYAPNTDADRAAMLRMIGVESIDDLFVDIPVEHRDPVLDLPPALPETDAIRHLHALGARNATSSDLPTFLGAGFYRHFVPALVDQQLLRSEWYTAYTPYQPEMAQGTLQAMYEFQSLVCDLTGMEVANASLYDGASALAEAVLLCRGLTRRPRVVIADTVHPAYREVAATYVSALDVDFQVVQAAGRDGTSVRPDIEPLVEAIDDQTSCVVIQRPDFLGMLVDTDPVVAAARKHGARVVIVVGDPVSLGLLVPPGELGADIVVGELRSLAGPPAYGGPGAGMFATKTQLIRRVPGRIAGRTLDLDGKTGFVLTLQTREQHIRRRARHLQHHYQPGPRDPRRHAHPLRAWPAGPTRNCGTVPHRRASHGPSFGGSRGGDCHRGSLLQRVRGPRARRCGPAPRPSPQRRQRAGRRPILASCRPASTI